MPYKLHPSGYCTYYPDGNGSNLEPRPACKHCGRVAGHAVSCPSFEYREDNGKTSRGSLYNATAILWAKYAEKSFITFTLPSLYKGYYQYSATDEATGDLAVAKAFSKVMEAYKLRLKRSGLKLCYVWVSEAQMSRKAKFGGIGDLHYHMVVNKAYKDLTKGWKDGNRMRYPFISPAHEAELDWLQNLWCDHVGSESANCVHVDPLPDYVESIPAYLAKYLGKESGQRMILSRRFACSRYLSSFQPVELARKPDDLTVTSEQVIQTDEWTTTLTYYKTSEVLEQYGHLMEVARMGVDGKVTGNNLIVGSMPRVSDTNAAATEGRKKERAYRDFWNKAVIALQRPAVDVTIRLPNRSSKTLHRDLRRAKGSS